MKWWVSCGCETWSVTAGKEHTLRVFLFTQGFPRGVSLHVCKEEECRITVQTQHCVSVFVFPYIGRSWGCVSEMCGAERGEVTQNWWKQSRGELHRILFWWSSQGRWGGWGIWHFSFGRIQTYAEFWWGNLMEGDRLENLGVDGRVILRRADLTLKGREDIAWINQGQASGCCKHAVWNGWTTVSLCGRNLLCGVSQLWQTISLLFRFRFLCGL